MILSMDGQNMYKEYLLVLFTPVSQYSEVSEGGKSMFRVTQLTFGFDSQQTDQ